MSKKINQPITKLHWLDLQGSGLSAIERLCLEEALLRHDPLNRCWAIVGTHHPLQHGHLFLNDVTSDQEEQTSPTPPNEDCVIIMGIGGKPEKLLDLQAVKRDGVTILKRFSGGGTVVVDRSSLWTTFIGRTHHMPHVPPHPRDIMEWSAKDIFRPAFSTMREKALHHLREGNNINGKHMKRSLVVNSRSCGSLTSADGSTVFYPYLPHFELKENDYVLAGKKIGGNAQAITKEGWLHHTSFLWDYKEEHMQYLSLPDKRPEYREDRHHSDFLTKLKGNYGTTLGGGGNLSGKREFFAQIKAAVKENKHHHYEIQDVFVDDAIDIINTQLGGMQTWFDEKCRTRIVHV